jgi:hypothetical protein
MKWFTCIITNSWCWLRRHNSFRNLIIGCCKLPYLSWRGYFINMSNRFGVLSMRLCIEPHCWDDYKGVTCGSFLSSCSIGIWWKCTYAITSCWGSLLGTSIGCIPLAWEHGCSCGWTTSWSSCYDFSNFNYLLGPLVIILSISQKLGFVTKARACKGAGQEWSPRVTFHVPESVGTCEGMNPHTPKWAPILGIRVPMDSQIFRGQLQGSKLIGLKSPLYPFKISWNINI